MARYERYNSILSIFHCVDRVNSCLAVAFGYFEKLFTLRDTLKVQQELARIKSMNRLLDQVGHQEYLYETFVDATEETFGQVIDSIQKNVPNESFLEDIFNDFSQSMSIITHFRVSSDSFSPVT
jgi:ubiquitin thioesterase protein OTUB1